MSEILDTIGDVAFTIAVIAANLFVFLYSTLARPWRTRPGLHIFSFMLVVALTLNHAAVLVNFPRYPGYLWARAILYIALAIVMAWRILILLRVQLKAEPKMDASEVRNHQGE